MQALASLAQNIVTVLELFVEMDILRDDEVHELKYKPGGRLDMSHGFLHHIRRNQIAR